MRSPAQVQAAMLGEGRIRIYGTLQIGHTIHEGHQRLQCWATAGRFLKRNIMDSTARTSSAPGVERFVLSPENVWYGRLKLLFTLSVHIVDRPSQLSSSAPTSPSAMRSS